MPVMVSGVRLGRASRSTLDRLYVDAARHEVTYDHVGSSVEIGKWPDRQPTLEHLSLGTGNTAFAAGVYALRHWAPQQGIGARIHPRDAPVAVGGTILVVLPFGPVEVIAPNRIVAVVDEPGVFGFAYGTLPGHPESGEESFFVRQRDDGTVVAAVTVDAVPGTLAARMSGPLVSRFQRVAIRRYLQGLAAASR